MSAGTVQSSKGHNDQRVPSNDLTLIDTYVQHFQKRIRSHYLWIILHSEASIGSQPAIQNRVNAPNLAALDDDSSRLGGSLSILCESNYPPVVPYRVKKAIQPHKQTALHGIVTQVFLFQPHWTRVNQARVNLFGTPHSRNNIFTRPVSCLTLSEGNTSFRAM